MPSFWNWRLSATRNTACNCHKPTSRTWRGGFTAARRKDNKEKRDAAVFSLWLACHTEEQIAEAVGMPRDTVHSVLLKYGDFRFSTKPGELSEIKDEAERWSEIEKRNRAAAEHKSDFEPPIYNIWKQQEKTRGVEHFGNSEIRWVDNLLYLYTKPFEIVVDPFAGS